MGKMDNIGLIYFLNYLKFMSLTGQQKEEAERKLRELAEEQNIEK